MGQPTEGVGWGSSLKLSPIYRVPAIPPLGCCSLGKGMASPGNDVSAEQWRVIQRPCNHSCATLQGWHSHPPLGDGETEAQSREGTYSGHRSGISLFLDVSLTPSIVPSMRLTRGDPKKPGIIFPYVRGGFVHLKFVPLGQRSTKVCVRRFRLSSACLTPPQVSHASCSFLPQCLLPV